MSVRPLNKRFALIVALYNCRKRDFNGILLAIDIYYIYDHEQLFLYYIQQDDILYFAG